MATWEVTMPLVGEIGDEALDKIREVAEVELTIRFRDVADPYDLAELVAALNQELAAMGVNIEIPKPRRVRTR